MEFLAIGDMSIWNSWYVSITLMVVGFGLLIFFHELGHFLVAKWVGIKVEEFALGFGRRIISFKRGETEYRLNLLPLGGYVKMLGQEDFQLKEGEVADPRAFSNRPIWARLAVISAGVVMNVVLAAVLFMVVFMIGIRFPAAEVGDVVPGFPAATAKLPGDRGVGLRSGDKVLAIDGHNVNKWSDLPVVAILSDQDQVFTMKIERPSTTGGKSDIFEVGIGTKSQPSETGAIRHSFGILPSVDRVIGSDDIARYLGAERLQPGDTVVSFNGQKIDHGWQLAKANRLTTDAPVTIVVERKDASGAVKQHTVELRPMMTWSEDYLQTVSQAQEAALAAGKKPLPEPEPFNVLGLQPRTQIASVMPGNSASTAKLPDNQGQGLKAGDIIAYYGDPRVVPTAEVMQKISLDYVGREAKLWIIRDGKEIGPIAVRPTKGTVPSGGGDKTIGLIGIANAQDDQHLVVAQTLPTSPFKDQIPSGATISAVNDTKVSTWSDLVNALKANIDQDVTISFTRDGGGEGKTNPLQITESDLHADRYEYVAPLPLTELMGEPRQTYNPLTATVWGVRETGDFIVQTYATLKQFIKGRVSGKDFSGPVGIFRMGVKVGETRGPVWLIWLLAIISANLAVINFLPLPIVDGGHAVFLAIEKVRGKPLSVKVQNVIQVIGLVLLGLVFVLITYNDILQWVRNKW